MASLVGDIVSAIGDPNYSVTVTKAFKGEWDDLLPSLTPKALSANTKQTPPRPAEEIMGEILDKVRATEAIVSQLRSRSESERAPAAGKPSLSLTTLCLEFPDEQKRDSFLTGSLDLSNPLNRPVTHSVVGPLQSKTSCGRLIDNETFICQINPTPQVLAGHLSSRPCSVCNDMALGRAITGSASNLDQDSWWPREREFVVEFRTDYDARDFNVSAAQAKLSGPPTIHLPRSTSGTTACGIKPGPRVVFMRTTMTPSSLVRDYNLCGKKACRDLQMM
jgi:hypothetical protein